MAGAITVAVRGAGVSGEGLRGRSVREVCLLGGAPRAWEAGDRVSWSGRVYRVEARDPAPAPSGYAHLAPGD